MFWNLIELIMYQEIGVHGFRIELSSAHFLQKDYFKNKGIFSLDLGSE